MAAETGLKLNVTQAGAAQAAAELQKVADAQGLVGTRVDATAKMAAAAQPAVEALAEAQAKLNELRAQRDTARESGAVEEVLQLNDAIGEQEHKVTSLSGEMAGLNVRSQDYVGLLNQIDPRLGAVAASLTRASRLASEFGISLGTVGLVIGGIYAVGKAVAYAAEQLEKATEATKKFEEANKTFLQQQRDVQQTIETISDKRREGGMTAEQARGARTTAEGVKGRFGADLEAGSVEEAVGMLSGTGASQEDMGQAAFLIQSGKLELDPKARPEARMRALRRAQQRNQGPLAAFTQRVAAQKREDAQEAAKQATSSGGPELDQAARAALGPGTTDEDIQDTLKTIMDFPTLGAINESESLSKMDPNHFRSDARPNISEEQADRARRVINYVTINNQNQRHIGADAATRQGRMNNGESKVRSLEGW